MKCLQIGDIHAEDSKIDEIKKCLDFAADTAEAERPDLIICTGDTFNSSEVKLDSRAAKVVFKTFARFADVAPVIVDIGTPSHDGHAAEVLRHVRGRYSVTVATEPMQAMFAGALVTVCPAPTKQFMQAGASIEDGNTGISAAMTAMFAGFGAPAAQMPDTPHILVGHWNTTGSMVHPGQDYIAREISVSFDQMMLAQPDLILLGHIHWRQKIGDRCFYNGSIYQKDYGEMDAKGFWIHDLFGKHLKASRFIKTPSRRLCRLDRDFTDGPQMRDGISPAESNAVKECHVRLDVTVWQDESDLVDKQKFERMLKDAGALSVDVRLIRIPRQTVRNEAVLKARSLREKLIAMAALRGETVPESILQKADMLEASAPDKIIQQVAAGIPAEMDAAA